MRLVVNILIALTFSITLLSCDSESASDCLQTEGRLVQDEVLLDTFTKIRIEEGINLILTQGDTQKVVVETGENLRNDVSVTIEDDTMVARDNNGCNLFRDYGVTTINVTSPNITEIINGSPFDVRSNGILNYEAIVLRSLVIPGLDLSKNGRFILNLNSNRVTLVANGTSVFEIEGATEELRVFFSDEQPRLEAIDLIAQRVSVRQVSSNHIFVNPQQSIEGRILGSGNVYVPQLPEIVEIEAPYIGRLIEIQ